MHIESNEDRMNKMIYKFSGKIAEGRSEQKALLGGKGANLAEMASLGISVPAGFTITTEVCTEYYKSSPPALPAGLRAEVEKSIAWMGEEAGKKFADPTNPLLVSVRSGARASMPGMMDTILNLGLNDVTVEGLAKKANNARFAYDAYRRFLTMYGNVVLELEHHDFEHTMNDVRKDVAKRKGIAIPADAEELARAVPDTALETEDLKKLATLYKGIIKSKTGKDFPSDPFDQLMGAIDAVFRSWNNNRAKFYRKMNQIPEEWGTAVNVQLMVFGNTGDTSGTGVCFTRNPSTGEHKFFGEWLPNAQGEDVVAGIRTPQPIAKSETSGGKSLEEVMPENYAQLFDIQKKLETHFKDMQDLEFTIEDRRLYMLQTRNGKRAGRAMVKIAVDMVKEGLIDEKTAIQRQEPGRVEELLFPTVDPKEKAKPIAKGLPASPGAVTGEVVFSAEDAIKQTAAGKKVILVRIETSPEDLEGMNAALGILTARGGATSHAAVVARGMGRSCVVGCSEITIDYAGKQLSAKDKAGNLIVVKAGEVITINGSAGTVYVGNVAKIDPELGGELGTLLEWCDKHSRMKVRTNADTPTQAKQARDRGAQGIGLCRTEHMFFEADRIKAVREMILSSTVEAREKALAKLLPYQTGDFIGLFKEMNGYPVTIRLLDPPLHEFLPNKKEQIEELAKEMGVSVKDLDKKVSDLHEFNPMLGHRGCRLGITFPEISRMQFRAILTAACKVKKEGVNVIPEIMIPLALSKLELDLLKVDCVKVAEEVFKAEGVTVDYKYGTMIELPRAALLADELAQTAEFFSFGTNDLTQTTLGMSRDDAGKFLPEYVDKKILKYEPFVSIDQEGVGQLVKMGCDKGKKTRPEISLGVCGEHGGDPNSIDFFERAGLKYVSCSPFRVPIARVAAAKAALDNAKK
jgi:pyruvate,orthophosphate dikinase